MLAMRLFLAWIWVVLASADCTVHGAVCDQQIQPVTGTILLQRSERLVQETGTERDEPGKAQPSVSAATGLENEATSAERVAETGEVTKLSEGSGSGEEDLEEESDEAMLPHEGPAPDDKDPEDMLCSGCLYHDGCEPEATREECDLEGGVWHLEDRATALVNGELAEFLSPTALDLDEDGEIVEAELKEVMCSFGQKSVTNASIEGVKEQLLRLTGPNLTEYEEKMNVGIPAPASSNVSNTSLIQEGKFWSAMITVATMAVDFTAHVSTGGNVGGWVVKQVTDPWNYLGFIPGGGAAKATSTIGRYGRYAKRAADYAGHVNTAYSTANNVHTLAYHRRRQPSTHYHSRYTGRSSSFQPRSSNRNCETQTGSRCGSAGRFAVCRAGRYCSTWGWCGTTSAYRPGQRYYSNNYNSKCAASSHTSSHSNHYSTQTRSSKKCERQTAHRCGSSTRGVCDRGRWCSSSGWCHSYYTSGKSEWSNNAGGICK